MHRVQLQYEYSDRLHIYVKEVAEVHNFLEERKTYFLFFKGHTQAA
jgi:hypothetical protein